MALSAVCVSVVKAWPARWASEGMSEEVAGLKVKPGGRREVAVLGVDMVVVVDDWVRGVEKNDWTANADIEIPDEKSCE